MIKTLLTAIVSAVASHIITKHYADKNVISLHRSYDRKLDQTYMFAYAKGWKESEEHRNEADEQGPIG